MQYPDYHQEISLYALACAIYFLLRSAIFVLFF